MFMGIFSSGFYVWILLFHILFYFPFGLFAMQMMWFVSKVEYVAMNDQLQVELGLRKIRMESWTMVQERADIVFNRISTIHHPTIHNDTETTEIKRQRT